jgi:lipoyl-dependent peroxiredoxin subunit D
MSHTPFIAPLAESEAAGPTAQTFGRLHELFGEAKIPGPFLVYARVPAFLQDFYMNFKKFVYSDGKLDARMHAILGLAVSGNAGCERWTHWFRERLTGFGMTDEQLAEVVAVAATNSMYNTFFKFRDLSGSDIFSGMSVGLRAHTFAGTSLGDKTVELINLVISDINACKPCTSGHVDKARQLGLSDDAILEAIQCSAVMQAGVQFLKAAGV